MTLIESLLVAITALVFAATFRTILPLYRGLCLSVGVVIIFTVCLPLAALWDALTWSAHFLLDAAQKGVDRLHKACR